MRQLKTDLLELSRRFFTCAFPQHVLGTLQTAASFLPWLRNQVVAASALEFSRLDDDRWQRLSSGLVAQLAATFGVSANTQTPSRQKQDRGREAVRRVHAKQYTQRGVTLQNPLYNAGRSIRQVEYRSLLYT